MRDFTGVSIGPHRKIADSSVHQEIERIWKAIGPLNYWAIDASRGMGRISHGLVPDGSATPIVSMTGAEALPAHDHSSGTQGGNLLNPVTLDVLDDTFTIHDATDYTKAFRYEISGIASLTTRIVTVPDASGEILYTDNVVTISNKTITDSTINTGTNIETFDSTFRLVDDLTQTKKLAWQLSGLTAATTRTWTAADASGTVLLGSAAGLPAAGSLVYGAGATTGMSALAIGASATILQVQAGVPSWVALSADATIAAGGALTIANNAVSNAKFRQGLARTVVGVTGNATANVADIQGTADQVLRINSGGTALAFGQVNLAAAAAVIGILPAANLGAHDHNTAATGGSTLNPVTFTCQDETMSINDDADANKKATFRCGGITSGTLVRMRFPDFDGGVLLVSQAGGAFNNQLPAAGSLVYGAGVTTGMNELAIGAVNKMLRSTGSAPAWSVPTWPNAATTGDLLYASATNAYTNLAIGAAATILTVTGGIPAWSTNAAVVDIIRTWQTLQTFKDTTFKLVDDADASKTAVFSLGAAAANADLTLSWAGTADRTVTIPSLAGDWTMAAINQPQTLTAAQTIDSDNGGVLSCSYTPASGLSPLKLVDAASGFAATITIPAGGFTANRTMEVPDLTGTLVTAAGTVTLSNKTLGTTGNSLRVNSVTSGVSFVDNGTTTKILRLICSGLAASTNNALEFNGTTEAKTWGFLDTSGYAPSVGRDTTVGAPAAGTMSKVDRVNQTAAIASVNATNGARFGMYQVTWYLETTFAGTGTGTIRLDVTAIDAIGSTTQSSTNLLLSATGRDRGVFSVKLTSGELSWATILTGTIGTSFYAVTIRFKYLG